eukprot:9532488-Lingulodinium_polyedra.AAC.1
MVDGPCGWQVLFGPGDVKVAARVGAVHAAGRCCGCATTAGSTGASTAASTAGRCGLPPGLCCHLLGIYCLVPFLRGCGARIVLCIAAVIADDYVLLFAYIHIYIIKHSHTIPENRRN